MARNAATGYSDVTITADDGTNQTTDKRQFIKVFALSCNAYDITLSVSSDSVSEGDGTTDITLTATRSNSDTSGAVSVPYTLGGTATKDTDYSVSSATLTIADGAPSGTATLSFTPTDDSDLEGNETIVISGAVPGKTVSDALVTLNDDDYDRSDEEGISLWVEANQQFLGEGDGATQATIHASRNGSGSEVTIDLQLRSSSSSYDTATQDTDYTVTALGSITIPNESSSTTTGSTITVTPMDDLAHEGNEHILITGTSGTRTVGNAHIVILDNDCHSVKPGTPSVSKTRFEDQMAPALDVDWATPSGATSVAGYEIRHCSIPSGSGTGDSKWTAHSQHLSSSDSTVNLPDLASERSYLVQVRALQAGNKPLGGWSNARSRNSNIPPSTTIQKIEGGSFPVETVQYGSVAGNSRSMKILFTPGRDGGRLRYKAEATHPLVADARLVEDPENPSTYPQDQVLYFWLYNPATTTITVSATDEYGGRASQTISVTGTRSDTREVVEDSPAGTAVGAPMAAPRHTANNNSGQPLSYTLTGDATSAFAIDSATGQITIKTGATLDYDTTSSYSGQVEYTVEGQNAIISLTINVLEADQNRPGTPVLVRTEFSEPSNPALDVSWTAPESPTDIVDRYVLRYRKQGDANWTVYNGTLGAKDNSLNLPDLEAGATYEAKVLAVLQDGTKSSSSGIGAGTANRSPGDVGSGFKTATLAWGGRIQGRIDNHFSDPDGDTLNYRTKPDHHGLLHSWIHRNANNTTYLRA